MRTASSTDQWSDAMTDFKGAGVANWPRMQAFLDWCRERGMILDSYVSQIDLVRSRYYKGVPYSHGVMSNWMSRMQNNHPFTLTFVYDDGLWTGDITLKTHYIGPVQGFNIVHMDDGINEWLSKQATHHGNWMIEMYDYLQTFTGGDPR